MTPRKPGTLTTVTVLFTDMVGSTSTRTRLGEELADEHFVLAGRCTDPPQQAYQPIAAAIEGLSRASPALLLRAGIDEECSQLARGHASREPGDRGSAPVSEPAEVHHGRAPAGHRVARRVVE